MKFLKWSSVVIMTFVTALDLVYFAMTAQITYLIYMILYGSVAVCLWLVALDKNCCKRRK